MKERIKPLDEMYNKCDSDGCFKPKGEVDINLIKSLLKSANDGLERSEMNKGEFEKKTKNYSFVLVEKYDILRKLIDAFLYFDKKNIDTHQCSNAFLCKEHSEMELDWNILETLRIRRNEANYKGKITSEEEWKMFKLQFDVYISTLIEEIGKKLNILEEEDKRE